MAWQHQASGPLFAPAVLLPGGRLAVAAVDGSISCLSSRDGSQLWRASVQGAVFAPMLPLPSRCNAGGAALLVGTQHGQLVALDSATGRQLGALQLGAKITGMQLLRRQTKAAAAEEEATAAAVGAAESGSTVNQLSPLLVVTLAPGVVAVLDIHGWLGSGRSAAALDSCVLDAVRLPADVFAAPAVSSSAADADAVRIAVGCRDDHLYCLRLIAASF